MPMYTYKCKNCHHVSDRAMRVADGLPEVEMECEGDCHDVVPPEDHQEHESLRPYTKHEKQVATGSSFRFRGGMF